MTRTSIELTEMEAAVRDISGVLTRSVPLFLRKQEEGRDRELRKYFTAAALTGAMSVTPEEKIPELACRIGAEVAYRFQVMEDEIEELHEARTAPKSAARSKKTKAKRRRT